MRLRNPFVQALLLVLAAAVIAVVANALAAPTRKLVLPAGFYPDALRVPPRQPVRVPPPPITETAALPTAAAADTTGTLVPVPDTATATVPEMPAVPTATVASPTPAAATTTTAVVTTSAGPKPPAPVPAAPAASPASVLARYQPHPDKAYLEIGGEEAAKLHAAGALFLDARRSAVYGESHITGARPFSVWEADLDDKVNALYEERQDTQDQPIVVYCTGGACEDSHMLSQKLWGIQFNNVYVYKDGFPDWLKRGGAVRTGAQP
ncbi:MAG: rhodanese-like domain-containing protein [Acidobacteriota bacterium]